MQADFPAHPTPLQLHPTSPTRRFARAVAPHRTPAHDTHTQHERRNYTRGQGEQGMRLKRTHAGYTVVREYAGWRAVQGRKVGQCLTCAHRRLAAPHPADK